MIWIYLGSQIPQDTDGETYHLENIAFIFNRVVRENSESFEISP